MSQKDRTQEIEVHSHLGMGHVLLWSLVTVFCTHCPSTLPLLIGVTVLRQGVTKSAHTAPDCPCSCVVSQQALLSGAVATESAYRLSGPTASSSYLPGLWVLGAGGRGLQTLAGELPGSPHCSCSDITLRVLEELEGKRGYF